MKTIYLTLSLIFLINSGFSQNGKIDINNLTVTVTPTNVMFQSLPPDTNTYFETNKGSNQSTIFSTATWMFGEDTTRQLTGFYETYHDTSSTRPTATGPLTCVAGSGTGGKRDYGAASISTSEIAKWNKVFCVNKVDIELFLRWYRNPTAFPGYSIPSSILDWPAHGDVSLFQDFNLAPFIDINLDGIYNPADGDYPCIKGDQYCWYITNDKNIGASHQPIGVEIHVEIYAFDKDSLNPLSNTIFVGKDIINRSTQTLLNFKVGQQTDLDIGCGQDDYIGSMPSLNSYYGYNGDATDDNCSGGKNPYGMNPPAQSITFLNQTMTTSMYYSNSSGNTGDPSNPVEANRYLNGRWKDGMHMKYGGNGYPIPIGTATGSDTNHVFPYLSSFSTMPWTEWSVGNPAGDRRILGAVGPITLTPGDVYEVDIAYVFSRNDSGNLSSVDKLYRDIQKVQAFYNDSIPTTCQAFVLSIPENNTINASVFPNPTTNSFTIETNDVNSKADILSVDGKVIATGLELNKSTQIDASSWENGLYLVRIYNEEGKFKVLRIIKN